MGFWGFSALGDRYQHIPIAIELGHKSGHNFCFALVDRTASSFERLFQRYSTLENTPEAKLRRILREIPFHP